MVCRLMQRGQFRFTRSLIRQPTEGKRARERTIWSGADKDIEVKGLEVYPGLQEEEDGPLDVCKESDRDKQKTMSQRLRSYLILQITTVAAEKKRLQLSLKKTSLGKKKCKQPMAKGSAFE
jgi:hypothetical protein